jgi:hypothetical protein
MRASTPLIAAALLFQGSVNAEEPGTRDPEFVPDADWDWQAQIEFFRRQFGDPEESFVPRWEQIQYDPRPAEGEARTGELILPLPCGGAMVFRRIEVAGDGGWLGERQVALGSADDGDAPFDGRRLAYISGSFSGDGRDPSARRHYYLGKYEVTELQYQVVSGPCPRRLDGRRPAVEVSWYDAVDFTRRYTQWLHQNAPETLPREDGVRGYLRLPTEVEWEYAARGGLAVEDTAFQERVFPTGRESIDDYAWIRESAASTFEPRPVGSLLPNPLGLYDILGNASELVFDLFRLDVGGRQHGQPGGFLVKGGHFRTWRKAIRSSWRQEHPHFNPVTGTANRLDTVGFRVAISAPVLTSARRIEAIRREPRPLAPGPVSLAAIEACRDLSTEVRSSLADLRAIIERCLASLERPSLPAFPSPPRVLAQPPAELPSWIQVRGRLDTMDIGDIRQHGLWFLNAYQPDAALVLFRRAAEQGDAWSALAVGAMFDPVAYEAEAFGPGSPRTREPNAATAMCWYRLAQDLGAEQAGVRIRMLETRGAGTAGSGASGATPKSVDCERAKRESGVPRVSPPNPSSLP